MNSHFGEKWDEHDTLWFMVLWFCGLGYRTAHLLLVLIGEANLLLELVKKLPEECKEGMVGWIQSWMASSSILLLCWGGGMWLQMTVSILPQLSLDFSPESEYQGHFTLMGFSVCLPTVTLVHIPRLESMGWVQIVSHQLTLWIL